MTNTASKFAAALAAGSLLVAGFGAGAAANAKPRLTPEQELAKALEGRVAGEPKDCLYLPRVVNTRIYDKTAIVYDTGTTLWVNRPDSGASSLDDNDIMVTTPWNAQLCNVDIVRMVDRNVGFWRGSVGLGKFVPYTKVKAEKAG